MTVCYNVVHKSECLITTGTRESLVPAPELIAHPSKMASLPAQSPTTNSSDRDHLTAITRRQVKSERPDELDGEFHARIFIN